LAEAIKGINVVIGSDTTGLSAALSDVNKKSRDIQSELKQVEKLLKLDPTNTELLAQKQKLLGDAVDNTAEKLNRLREAQKQVEEQFKRGEISEGQYRAFQREVAKTEQELRSLEGRLDDTGKAFQDAGKDAESAASKIKRAGDGLKGVGEKMALGITAPIVGIAALATEGTEEFRKFTARLSTNAQIAGASMEEMEQSLRDVYAITGELDSGVEGLSNLLAAGFKGDAFREALDAITGAAIKFSDTLKFEGIADGLQETLATGAAIGPFAELLERSGVSLDDFNAGLTEAIANGQQQQYVLQQLADLGLPEVNEAYRENNQALVENANAQYDLQQSMAELGNTLTPIISMIIGSIASLVGWFNDLDDGTKKTILTLVGIGAAIGPVLIILGQLITSVGAISGVFAAAGGASGLFGAAIAAITGPIGIAVAAVAGLIAIFTTLYKNNEDFRIGVQRIWEQIRSSFKTALDAISSTVDTVIRAVTDFVKSELNELKRFWDENGQAILAIVKQVFGLIKSYIDVQLAAIKEIFQAVWPVVESIVKVAWEGIKLVISSALDIIKGVISTFVKVLKGDWRGAWNDIEGIFEDVWNNIEMFLKNINLVQIGKDIMQGLINGITTMIGAIKSAVSNVASTVTGGLKSALGIQSPSKVMRQLGEYTGEGFALGIGNTISDVRQQAANMASATTGALAGVSSPSFQSGATGGTFNFEGMFAGATFVVRDDSDFEAIGRVVYEQVNRAQRGLGVMPG
jgi:phage-related minor tail protein